MSQHAPFKVRTVFANETVFQVVYTNFCFGNGMLKIKISCDEVVHVLVLLCSSSHFPAKQFIEIPNNLQLDTVLEITLFLNIAPGQFERLLAQSRKTNFNPSYHRAKIPEQSNRINE